MKAAELRTLVDAVAPRSLTFEGIEYSLICDDGLVALRTYDRDGFLIRYRCGATSALCAVEFDPGLGDELTPEHLVKVIPARAQNWVTDFHDDLVRIHKFFQQHWERS